MKNKRIKKKGFTLVELLIVIAIIAILAAVVAPNAFRAVDRSKVSSVVTNYKQIKTGIFSYRADTSVWPATAAEIAAATGVNGYNGPYIDKFPTTNPWGGTYAYKIGATGAGGAGLTNTYRTLEVTGVTTAAATQLEENLDGGTSEGTGTDNSDGVVRWDDAVAADGTKTLYLVISEQ